MPIILAWLIGESIVGYRWAKNGAPPPPGAVAAASIIFLGCAVVGTFPAAKNVAIAFAFCTDLAVLLKVLPGGNATQATNWPPQYIPCGSLFGVAGGGVAAPPDCSGSAALSSTSGGRNPGTTPLAGSAVAGTPPLGYPSGPATMTPVNGKCQPGYSLSPNRKVCVKLVSGQVAG